MNPLLLLALIPCFHGFEISENYAHHVSLKSEHEFEVYWSTTGKNPNDFITFEVHAKTKGYVALGFSPNGAMAGADIVVGGVNDQTNQPYLQVNDLGTSDWYYYYEYRRTG